MPATNAVSERFFSNLRRVKSYLRASMSQERIDHLMILHIYKEESDKLDLINIGNQFVQKNLYRQCLFGNFTDDDTKFTINLRPYKSLHYKSQAYPEKNSHNDMIN
ncbi:hypothetical protein KUTeg_003509 [Tegillarca granosa]|uniref:HAT C-terminal dimerisation domain-containing protein n=1 Tax=Tegillarca granosa TaxID=220873 RepID=A0ABQ9FRV3_TEGGR|nr:hypothetical protein KUTeg_003509 [Tegillarca granosa]